MKEPIELAAKNGLFEGLFPVEQIERLILGHEIFHFLEEQEEGIYTRREKVILWKLFGYKSKSTVRALSEIAACIFQRK